MRCVEAAGTMLLIAKRPKSAAVGSGPEGVQVILDASVGVIVYDINGNNLSMIGSAKTALEDYAEERFGCHPAWRPALTVWRCGLRCLFRQRLAALSPDGCAGVSG